MGVLGRCRSLRVALGVSGGLSLPALGVAGVLSPRATAPGFVAFLRLCSLREIRARGKRGCPCPCHLLAQSCPPARLWHC